jgi:hypothetical protein
MKKAFLAFSLMLFLFVGIHAGLNAQEAIDQAADDVHIYFAHGVHGTAIGELPTFPMDIYINGILKMKNAKFGKAVGPKKISPGNTSIDVYRAGEGPDTGHTPMGQYNFVFKPYENVTIAAYLDADQESVVQKFNNDLSPTGDPSKCRVILHNLGVGWISLELYNKKDSDGHPTQGTEQLEPGDKCVFELAKKILTEPYKGESMAWQLVIGEGGENFIMTYNKNFAIKPGKAILVYIVGSYALNTLKVAKKTASLN